MVWPKKLWEGIATDIVNNMEFDFSDSPRRRRNRRPIDPHGAGHHDMGGPPSRGPPSSYDHGPPPSASSRGDPYRGSDERSQYSDHTRRGPSHSSAGYRHGRDEGFPSMSDLGSALPPHRSRGRPPSPGYSSYDGGSPGGPPSPPPYGYGGGGRHGGGPSSRSSFGGPPGPPGCSRGPALGTFENPYPFGQGPTNLGGGGRYGGGPPSMSSFGGPPGLSGGSRGPALGTFENSYPFGQGPTNLGGGGGRPRAPAYSGGGGASEYGGSTYRGGGSTFGGGASTYGGSEYGESSYGDEPTIVEIRPRGYGGGGGSGGGGGGSYRRERSSSTRPSHDRYDNYSPQTSYRTRRRSRRPPTLPAAYSTRSTTGSSTASSTASLSPSEKPPRRRRYCSRRQSHRSPAPRSQRSSSSLSDRHTSRESRYPSRLRAYCGSCRQSHPHLSAAEPPSPEYEIRVPRGNRSPSLSSDSSSRSCSPASSSSARSPSPASSHSSHSSHTASSPLPTPPSPASLPALALRDLLVGRTFCHWPDFRLADIFKRKYPAHTALHHHASLLGVYLRLEKEKGEEWVRWAAEGEVGLEEKKGVHRELHADGERWGDGQAVLDALGWACRRCAEEGGTYRRVLSGG